MPVQSILNIIPPGLQRWIVNKRTEIREKNKGISGEEIESGTTIGRPCERAAGYPVYPAPLPGRCGINDIPQSYPAALSHETLLTLFLSPSVPASRMRI